MKKKNLILLSVFFVAVLVAAGVLYSTLADRMETDQLTTLPSQEEPAETEETEVSGQTEETVNDQPQDFSAPDFTVVDLDGNEHKLSDFGGKPIVLNFWASWCGPCKSEMPDFQEAYGEYGDAVHFVMVNLTDGSQETVETASEFIESQGYTFPVYYDTAYSAAMAYRVNAVPVTYFISAEGQLVAYGQGALDAATLRKGIDMILPDPE